MIVFLREGFDKSDLSDVSDKKEELRGCATLLGISLFSFGSFLRGMVGTCLMHDD